MKLKVFIGECCIAAIREIEEPNKDLKYEIRLINCPGIAPAVQERYSMQGAKDMCLYLVPPPCREHVKFIPVVKNIKFEE